MDTPSPSRSCHRGNRWLNRRRAPSSCPATAIMPTPGRPNGQGTRALIARPHVEVVADQLPLEHRDGRLRIAVQALVDGDAGFETLWRKAPLDSAMRELLDEHAAVGRIGHRGLGVAACGDDQAGNQRHEGAGKQRGCLFHLSSFLQRGRVIAARGTNVGTGLDRNFVGIAVLRTFVICPSSRCHSEGLAQMRWAIFRSSAARSPMTTHAAIVLPVVTRGMMDASAIRRFLSPNTLSSPSTTDIAFRPIRAAALWCQEVAPPSR